MEDCPYCRISGRPSSRIRAKIQANCVKNRSGACAACGKLARIDRKIDEARRVLNCLLDEREELAHDLNDHHDPLVNRLPPEIVTKIFLDCQTRRPGSLDGYLSDNTKPFLPSVLTPGHVCRSWRSISQRSPRLWSVLLLVVTKKTCVRVIEVAQHWLHHSAGTPLHANICALENTNMVRPFVLKLFSLVATTAHRWETLHLNIAKNLVQSFSDMMSNRHLNLLKALKLRCSGDFTDGVLSLNASPLVLINEGRGTSIMVGTERLVHFELVRGEPTALEDYVHLFKAARGLSSCTISSPPGERITVAGSPADAPSLLTIHARDVHGNLWDHFVFPKLQTLYLYRHTAWKSLHSLLRRSKCSITVLRLDFKRESLDMVVGIFEQLQDLEKLDLDIEGSCDFDLFSRLDAIASNHRPRAFSKLTSLSFTVYDPRFDWNPLLVFLTNITSRNEGSLRSFVFSYEAYYHFELNGETEWMVYDVLLPMDAHTIRFAADVTRNLEDAMIFDINGMDALEEYR